MADDEATGIGALLSSLGSDALGKLFGSYAKVGEAMPEAYGANSPIRDPIVSSALGIGSMVAGPGQLMQPNPYPAGSEGNAWFEDQRDKGMKDWSAGTALNLAGIGSPFAPTGAAGIFGGRLAKTADLGALRTAEDMHAAGAPRAEIWDKTGWFRGEDGKWRFEIPDDKARMNPNVYGSGIPSGRWGKIAGEVWHPELYEAYPDLRNATGMVESRLPGSPAGGSYSAPGLARSGEETIHVQAATPADARSIALHEMQHAVQEREGFSSGGNPAMFSQGKDAELAASAMAYRRELEGLDPKLSPKQKDDVVRKRYEEIGAPEWFPSQEARDVAHDIEGNPPEVLSRVMELYGTDRRTTPYTPRELYRKVPGEVEARNVQTRADWTPEQRRAKPPWETVDTASPPIMNSMFGSRVGMLER